MKTERDIENINQRILAKLVDREVLHCLSRLVSHFAEHPEACCGEVDADEVMALQSAPDWETAWDNSEMIAIKDSKGDIYILSDDEAADEPVFSNDPGDESEDGEYKSRDEWLHTTGTLFDDGEEDDYQQLCETMDIDCDDYLEALEHLAVTSWFSGKLGEQGEIVGDLLGFDVWGRTCSGQAISMDGVIRDIASDMKILHGQENSWSDHDGNM